MNLPDYQQLDLKDKQLKDLQVGKMKHQDIPQFMVQLQHKKFLIFFSPFFFLFFHFFNIILSKGGAQVSEEDQRRLDREWYDNEEEGIVIFFFFFFNFFFKHKILFYFILFYSFYDCELNSNKFRWKQTIHMTKILNIGRKKKKNFHKNKW